MITNEKLESAISILIQQAKPRRIVLFGSYARGEAKPDSDADFLVITEKKSVNRFTEATNLRRHLSHLRIPVDIIVHDQKTISDYAQVPGTLLYSIMREGKIVYEKE